jgi:hypothetical protein
MNVFMGEMGTLDQLGQGSVYKYVNRDKLVNSKAKIKKFSYDIMRSKEKQEAMEEAA